MKNFPCIAEVLAHSGISCRLTSCGHSPAWNYVKTNYGNRPWADCFNSFLLLNLKPGPNVLKYSLKQLLPRTRIPCWIRQVKFFISSGTTAKPLRSLLFQTFLVHSVNRSLFNTLGWRHTCLVRRTYSCVLMAGRLLAYECSQSLRCSLGNPFSKSSRFEIYSFSVHKALIACLMPPLAQHQYLTSSHQSG